MESKLKREKNIKKEEEKDNLVKGSDRRQFGFEEQILFTIRVIKANSNLNI